MCWRRDARIRLLNHLHTHISPNEKQSGGVKLCYTDGARLVTDHTAFYSLTELITHSCVSSLPAKKNAGRREEEGRKEIT